MTTSTLTPTTIRSNIKRIAYATIDDSHNWTYDAVRPMDVPSSWTKGQKVKGDCSKYCQYIWRWASGPDPMENSWADWGNSSRLWLVLAHADSPDQLRVGDIVTFGHDGDEHAAFVLETGTDPLLGSFGHQGAPNAYRLSQDGREHQLLFAPLANDGPPAPPTPVARLKAKTGYFSWVAWRLGEGEWKKYGEANRLVRPNVKKLIPAGWWIRYAKFKKNRKRAG